MSEMTTAEAMIDLDRFPLNAPGSAAYAALVERSKAELAARGMFDLVGFLRPAALAAIVADVAPRFETDGFTHARRHNIYFRKVTDLPTDHPALREVETVNRTLCADVAGSLVGLVYGYPPLAKFLAEAMEKRALHVMDDPLARVNVMRYGAGEALNWHFDRSEFTTTLLLQAPGRGGAFEYRTGLRSENDPNYDGVARLLRGEDPEVRNLSLEAGTLNVFRGKNTAHRVTPVEGSVPRIIAVFSYYERPGVTFSDEERIGFYGRAA